MRNLCANCGIAEAKCKSRCMACYRYLQQHGTERPLKMIERWQTRDHDPNDCLPDDVRVARAKQRVRELGLGR